MPNSEVETTAALIAEGAALKAKIAKDSERLKEIADAVIAKLPPGKHEGNDGAACTIIAPSPSVKPSAEDAEAVREIAGDDAFKKLFERVVSFKPVKAFREVLAAITDKRTTAKVLSLVEKDSTASVKWA